MLHDTVHLFDIMRFFAGDIEWVLATATNRKRPEHHVEDTSLSIFQFKSGVDAIVLADELTEYAKFDIELHFERGLLRLGSQYESFGSIKRPSGTEDWWYTLKPDAFPELSWEDPGILVAAKDLVGAIEEDRECRGTGHDGRAGIEAIMAIYESQRRGNEKVYFPFEEPRRMVDVLREEGML